MLTPDEIDICELVLRAEFWPQANNARFFVSIMGKDAPPSLLARFRSTGPRISAHEKFVIGRDMSFSVEIRMRPDGRCDAVGAWYRDPLGGAVLLYSLAKKDGAWVIEKAEMVGQY